jgi:hypothetical protein
VLVPLQNKIVDFCCDFASLKFSLHIHTARGKPA